MRNLFTLFLFTFILFSNFSVAQPPTYSLIARNFSLEDTLGGNDNMLKFDMNIQWTNQGSSDPFNYGSCQYCFTFNNTGIANGGTLAFAKISSELLPSLQGATFHASGNQLRISGNLPGAIQVMNSSFPGTLVARVRLSTTASSFALAPFALAWRNTGSGLITKISYLDPNGLGVFITNAASHTIDSTIIHINPSPPTANFYADQRTIYAGQSVNFFDSSSYTPTSWQWTFTGASPLTSTIKNPTSTTYNAAGTYPVKLRVFNQAGSDSITKTNYITVNPPLCTPNWQNKLVIKDAANARDTLVFGTAPGATAGIDTCLGERIIPPIPPSQIFDVRFNLPTGDDSKRDFRMDSVDIITWKFYFQPSGSNTPMTINWDNLTLPNTGFFYLKDNFGGTVTNINMKNQNSYVVPVGLNALRIEYVYAQTLSIHVDSLWNLISVPILALDSSVSAIFPNALSPAYQYTSGSGYAVANSLSRGKGYWLKSGRDTLYRVTGIPFINQNIPVSSGWNIIGPFDQNIPVNSIVQNPPGIVQSSFYKFKNGIGYQIADTLKPSSGYWVKVSVNGIISKGQITDNIISENTTTEGKTAIEIRNGNEIRNLYVTEKNNNIGDHTLPPVPPSGVFDARFASDNYSEEYGKNHIIKISSTEEQVTIKFDNLNGRKFKLSDVINGNLFSVVIKEGIEVTIPDNIDNMILTEENIIPDNYSLGQNYPNPFNPSTTIKFQILTDGNVQINLFNVLGQEVATIVNGFKKAGVYEEIFDASNLSSGIYFYKIKSGTFSDMKRMVLLK
ncbi:MAG: T9SS type A sorting domain-containing protein [bacterium]|nr:T9SS type A sorting domain-containing protein [bacterium]